MSAQDLELLNGFVSGGANEHLSPTEHVASPLDGCAPRARIFSDGNNTASCSVPKTL
jgi:hypothetical protein